jgi:hypothetical protein
MRNGLLTGLSLLVLMGALAGCGGGDSSAAAVVPPAPPTPPAAIEGIATPSSVAVVTATNAQ